MASLTIVVDGAEHKVPLETAAVTLGRGLESDIRLKDIKASRRHCQIVKSPKGYQCVDLSSGNGTYVNGVQIKAQLLEPGDKITIGSTTIAFDDAPAAPKAAPARSAAPKAPTAKIPVTASAAPVASSKSATAKIPTERVLVAPTRKITARVDAVKPASQGALKPASQPPAKPGSRVGRTTGRTPAQQRPSRPAAETAGKKSPVLFIAIGAAAVLLAAGGYFFFGTRDNGEQVRAQIEQLVKQGKEAETAERFDAAIQAYRRALDLCQGDRFKVRASDIGKVLQLLEARRAPGGGTPPKPDPKDSPEKGPDFQAKRTEITDKYRLGGDPSAADWSGAVKEWSDFASRKPAGDSLAKAQGEIRGIQLRAREDLDRLRKKADALAQENKMAEAVAFLKQQIPRFEHTEVQGELQGAIKQLDK